MRCRRLDQAALPPTLPLFRVCFSPSGIWCSALLRLNRPPIQRFPLPRVGWRTEHCLGGERRRLKFFVWLRGVVLSRRRPLASKQWLPPQWLRAAWSFSQNCLRNSANSCDGSLSTGSTIASIASINTSPSLSKFFTPLPLFHPLKV